MINIFSKRSLGPLQSSSKSSLRISRSRQASHLNTFHQAPFIRLLLPSSRKFSTTRTAMTGGELKKISTSNAAPPAAAYSQGIVTGHLLFVSGQIPADKEGNLVKGSIADKTRACAENVKAIVEAAGTTMDKVAKCTVFIDDMNNFAEMNAEYEKHFPHRPSRSCVAVKTLPKNVPVEIECIAVV